MRNVIVGSSAGTVHCLDKVGKILWVYNIEGEAGGIAAAKNSRMAFIASSSGMIHCLDKNGLLSWEYESGGPLLAIDYSQEGKKIIASSRNGTIYYLNDEGKIITKADLKESIDIVAITKAGEMSLAAGENNKLFCMDGMGNVQWEKTFEEKIGDAALSSDGEIIAVACHDSRVHTFDRDGTEKWKQELGGPVLALDVVEQSNRIFTCIFNKGVVGLDSQGAELFMFETVENMEKIAASEEGDAFVVVSASGDVLHLEFIEEDMEVFYEILCRGDAKCGTFVSAVYTPLCPRCGSEKNVVRIIKEKI